jgi:hypothetical protein
MNCLPLTMHSIPPGFLLAVGVLAGMGLGVALVALVDWLARRQAVRP